MLMNDTRGWKKHLEFLHHERDLLRLLFIYQTFFVVLQGNQECNNCLKNSITHISLILQPKQIGYNVYTI